MRSESIRFFLRSMICILITASLSHAVGAQEHFPTGRAEDTCGIMSEAYWNIWNEQVNAEAEPDRLRFATEYWDTIKL